MAKKDKSSKKSKELERKKVHETKTIVPGKPELVVTQDGLVPGKFDPERPVDAAFDPEPARMIGSRYLRVELASSADGVRITCQVDDNTWHVPGMRTKVEHLLASAAALLSSLPAPEGVPPSMKMSVSTSLGQRLSKGEVLKTFEG